MVAESLTTGVIGVIPIQHLTGTEMGTGWMAGDPYGWFQNADLPTWEEYKRFHFDRLGRNARLIPLYPGQRVNPN